MIHTYNHLLCTHSTIYYALQPLQAFKRESERESVQSRGSRSLVIIDFDMSYSRLNIWFNDEDGSFKETQFAEFDTCIL